MDILNKTQDILIKPCLG